jgi:mannose/fructose/N-acetylgalactosamine-specific phosphotransferase system component IID
MSEFISTDLVNLFVKGYFMSKVIRRRVVATMTRGQSKEVIMVRHFGYFDTAMPRMLQLAISYCNEGDFIEFASVEFGYQLGVLHVRKKGRFDVEMSPLVKASPSLLKLMSEKE